MKKIRVVCGIIINDDNHILITRRNSGDFKGKWEFPGGKVEENEEDKISLMRELNEELNIQVSIDDLFMIYNHTYETFTVELVSFLCMFSNGEIKLVDHDQYEWVETNRLKEFDFLDGDIPIINNIVSNNISIPN